MNKEVEATPIPTPEKEPTRYEYGDFTLECGKCGLKQVLFENDKGGRKIEHSIFTTDVHEMKMACEECGNFMRLYYQEASNPPVEELTLAEEVEDEKNKEENGTPEAEANKPISVDDIQESTEVTAEEEVVEEAHDEEPVQEKSKTKE